MKASELREKDDKELLIDLDELQNNLFKMRMRERSSQNARHHQFGQTRRDIARIKTILLERQRASVAAAATEVAETVETAETAE